MEDQVTPSEQNKVEEEENVLSIIKDHHNKVMMGFQELGKLIQHQNTTLVEMLKDIQHDKEVIEKHIERIEGFEQRVTDFIEKFV